MDHLNMGRKGMNKRLANSGKASFLIVAFNLCLCFNFNFISREILLDCRHDLVQEVISQASSPVFWRDNDTAKGNMTFGSKHAGIAD